jgi:hypothetical protein
MELDKTLLEGNEDGIKLFQVKVIWSLKSDHFGNMIAIHS